MQAMTGRGLLPIIEKKKKGYVSYVLILRYKRSLVSSQAELSGCCA